MKGLAYDMLNITHDIKFAFHRVEDIVGKGENAVFQHFLLFQQYFQKAFSLDVSKFVLV